MRLPIRSTVFSVPLHPCSCGFVFTDTPTTQIYTLSLHDALPISVVELVADRDREGGGHVDEHVPPVVRPAGLPVGRVDRKSTRLNSSHLGISYAVFCLKKKNSHFQLQRRRRLSHTPLDIAMIDAR